MGIIKRRDWQFCPQTLLIYDIYKTTTLEKNYYKYFAMKNSGVCVCACAGGWGGCYIGCQGNIKGFHRFPAKVFQRLEYSENKQRMP